MLIPLNVDVPMDRWPWANWAVIGTTVLLSAALFGADEESRLFAWMILDRGDFNPVQLVGHLYAHGGILHLVGNMVFLFCFGNAVNAKLGHAWYLALYHALGVVAGLGWLAVGNGPRLVGASGAIMGVVGAFVVFFPKNDVKLFYWFGWFWRGTVDLSAYWVIGMYVLFDLWGLAAGGKGAGVAYIAHVVGAAAGAAAAAGLIKLGFGAPNEYELNLLQVLAERCAGPTPARGPAVPGNVRAARSAPAYAAARLTPPAGATVPRPPARRPATGERVPAGRREPASGRAAAPASVAGGLPPIPVVPIPLAGPFATDEQAETAGPLPADPRSGAVSIGPVTARPPPPRGQPSRQGQPQSRGQRPAADSEFSPAVPPDPYDVR